MMGLANSAKWGMNFLYYDRAQMMLFAVLGVVGNGNVLKTRIFDSGIEIVLFLLITYPNQPF